MIGRRHVLAGGLALPFVANAQAKARVVVVGGGFGGATAARFLRQYDPAVDVTLLEPNDTFIACPFSNAVIAGERTLDAQQFGYGAVRADGVVVVNEAAASVDPVTRTVTVGGGRTFSYDRLILSPG